MRPVKFLDKITHCPIIFKQAMHTPQKKYQVYFCIICLFLFFAESIAAAPTNIEQPKDNTNLARVAILKFINSSKSASHKWVENSLPDAIDLSMEQRFEFLRTDKNSIKKLEKELQPAGDTYSQKTIRSIALKSHSDIIIYGNFKLTKNKNKLLIHAVVYNAAGNRIIGEVSKKSSLSNRVFKAIDVIAADIVKDIYRYALRSEEVKGEEVGKKKLRLLVLVPSYKTKKEKKKAIRELELMKRQLNGKYRGEFITIFEYYRRFRVPKKERKRVRRWAKKRKLQPLVAWLSSRGVKDAFIIRVRKKKISIIPLIRGASGKKIVYAINATAKEKRKALAKVTRIAQVRKKEKKKPEKISLKKSSFKGGNNAVRLMAGGSLNFGKLKTFIPSTLAGQLNGNYNMLFPWLNLYFSADGAYGKASNSANSAWFAGAKAGLLFPYFSPGSFHFSAFAASGAYAGRVGSSALFVLPVAEVGNIIDYYFTSRVSLSLTVSAGYFFEINAPALLANAYLGLGYRL